MFGEPLNKFAHDVVNFVCFLNFYTELTNENIFMYALFLLLTEYVFFLIEDSVKFLWFLEFSLGVLGGCQQHSLL